MPNLGKGTECIKILLSQASKDIKKTLFRCFCSGKQIRNVKVSRQKTLRKKDIKPIGKAVRTLKINK
jgi:hypothetical protein